MRSTCPSPVPSVTFLAHLALSYPGQLANGLQGMKFLGLRKRRSFLFDDKNKGSPRIFPFRDCKNLNILGLSPPISWLLGTCPGRGLGGPSNLKLRTWASPSQAKFLGASFERGSYRDGYSLHTSHTLRSNSFKAGMYLQEAD